MKKWEIMFDKFWDKLEEYNERYAPLFFIFAMFYLILYLVFGVSV